ncbi:MAG: HD domain-containing protein [Chloroflexi bacterium]|nr:HD domain-containing protein [Chloroflexota bacterium]
MRKKISFANLRARLFILVLLAVIPSLILFLRTGLEQRDHAAEDSQSYALFLARQAASEQEQLIDEARQFLATLALLPQIQDSNPETCNDLLARLIQDNQRYTSLGLVDLDGSIICSSIPITDPINVLDRPHIQGALQTSKLTIEEYQISPATNSAVMSLAYPVLDDQGNTQLVLSTGLDLDWINRLLSYTQLPEGASLAVIDHHSTILAHYPDTEAWVGRAMPDSPLAQEIQSHPGDGTLQAIGIDGIERLYAYTPLHGTANDGAYVIIGIPTEVAYADINRILLRNLIWLGLAAVLTFAAAWIGGDKLFLRRVDALLRATQRLANGDLSARTELPYDQGELSLLARSFDQMAESLGQHVTELEVAKEDVQRHLRHLRALRNIDIAITSSLDLRVTLNVVLDQVANQLDVDAASILHYNAHMQNLEFAAGRGFRRERITETRLQLGQGKAGLSALEQRIISVPNLVESDFIRRDLVIEEDFVTYYAVPLLAKGQIKGVLEIFHRSPLEPDHDWFEFLETLAGQAAIAIDNANLFSNLQRSNLDLALAYDTTLEGWSSALDLRDKETEGHTQRVTEMTVQLAQAMGVPENELVQIKRGALLHDIGKMGIPDAILHKPGPLDDDEWGIMRQHPAYAYKLLSPITYLRPALEIPYSHHEKWDGTGYPRGLSGEQIPLEARIFAVVDVWDALRSDRPYRDAWPKDKVLEHIHQQAGKHFDPKVVEAFLKFIV